MDTMRFDSSARRFTARLANAVDRQKIGITGVFGLFAALEHQHACRRSEKLACDRQSGGSAAYYDKISVKPRVGAQSAKIFYAQSFSPSLRRHYSNDCRLAYALDITVGLA